MEWRIRESGHGGFVAERGMAHEGGERISGMLGFTMPAFIVYEMSHFDTRREAEKYVNRRKAELKEV